MGGRQPRNRPVRLKGLGLTVPGSKPGTGEFLSVNSPHSGESLCHTPGLGLGDSGIQSGCLDRVRGLEGCHNVMVGFRGFLQPRTPHLHDRLRAHTFSPILYGSHHHRLPVRDSACAYPHYRQNEGPPTIFPEIRSCSFSMQLCCAKSRPVLSSV